LHLLIVHNHFRPGGVRRVIETGTPYLVQRLRPRVCRVVIAAGEPPPKAWWSQFRSLLRPVPVACVCDPALQYISEQPGHGAAAIRGRLRESLVQLLAEARSEEWLVWAHNQGLGRNLLLSQELQRACAARQVPLVFHHHDWWFDNRWQRWPEMRRTGFRSLSQVAAAILSGARHARHIAINNADATVLQHHFPLQSGWLPNPIAVSAGPSPHAMRAARRWLADQLGTESPVWLMPCRLLRRKNIAEALLLTRWLRPDACLVTTGGTTSPEEQPYADRLRAAARRHAWPLRLSVLERHEARGPIIAHLLGASEAVLLTSLQEGFGLPYLEAAMAERALIARRLPNITPDLEAWGLRFPQSYDEVLIDPALLDWRKELARQETLLRSWREGLPAALRRSAGMPPLLRGGTMPGAVPFSRLTLTAQIEVLAYSAAESWSACAPLNPWLNAWRDAAHKGRLAVTTCPERALRHLGGAAFARGFTRILKQAPPGDAPRLASVEAQCEFVKTKLEPANLYPLSWRPKT
jgi:glycosyltransferase involved in cell wall biosynthesis